MVLLSAVALALASILPQLYDLTSGFSCYIAIADQKFPVELKELAYTVLLLRRESYTSDRPPTILN